MRVYNKKFLEFLEGNDKHFVIPVYQRNYDWTKEQCKRLFEDILEIHKKNYLSHFLGTIVSIYDEQSEQREYLIIDGQQRITTLSLLLLSLYDLLDKGEIKGNINKDEIRDEYLVNKYSEGDKRIRLKPVKDDNNAFVQLFKSEEEQIPDSNVTKNYGYFNEWIKKLDISIEDFYKAIKKLMIVEIELIRSEDDPQMIFESLNSTGLSLTQSDLVRNFILMKQPSKDQEQFYNKYWYVIEKNTKFNVDNFIRDFLTYKERVIPNKDKVYGSFKKFVKQNHPENIEKFLEELLKFSKYYNKIAFSREEDEDINNVLKKLNKLEVSVSYPFLLEVFDDYNKGVLNKQEVVEILKILESFAFRRIITDLPTNALNKIFQVLGRDIKKIEGYGENYLNILKYLLTNKKGSQKFPTNSDFSERFKTRDVYNLKSKNRLYLLESLENFENKEEVKIDELSVEHIMPQTLNQNWISILGPEFHQIHEKWLHSIGNITLTGYNSKMSNKSFLEKRDMEKGFKESRLFLNKYLSELGSWDENEIKKRADILYEVALKIWDYPKTDYVPPKNTDNLYGLSDDHSFNGEKIESYIFQEKETKVKNWREFYQSICLQLYDIDSNKFKNFLSDDDFKMKKRNMISFDKDRLFRPLKISDTIYLESNLNTDALLNILRLILKKFEIEEDEISIYLRENKE